MESLQMNIEPQATRTKHARNALLLSIIPGVGQFYNGQKLKGSMYLILTIIYLATFFQTLNLGFWGLITLGEIPMLDHSIRLLIDGILALLITVIGLVIYGINLFDAYQNGKKRDLGIPLNSLREQYQNLIDNGFPYLIISPGVLLLVFVVIFPIIFSFLLAFTSYDLYHSPPANLVDWVGLQNFIDIFKIDIWRKTFFNVFGWTLIWTFAATTLQVALGIFLAVLVNQKDLKGKAIIRTVFILPWAVPAFVSILVFSGMFNESFGVINTTILASLGIDPISWMTESNWTRLALILIQGWLGFPFIFAMTTGVLQSISEDLYEAATIDFRSCFMRQRRLSSRNTHLISITLILSSYLIMADQRLLDRTHGEQTF